MKAVRPVIQSLFLVLTLSAGWRFLSFYRFLQDPSLAEAFRPPAVEGFLPISATLAFRQWLGTGVFDRIHPAGLVLLLLIFGSALLAGRVFCGWICPVGTVSEYWGAFGAWTLKRFGRSQFKPGRSTALALSLPKYVLLAFFIYICWFALSLENAVTFLAGPYNQVADIKMLLLFIKPGLATLVTLGTLGISGFLIKNYWCRMLCPYGAALGTAGLLAPVRIACDQALCDQCGACERVCGNALKPHKNRAVENPDCTLCMSCCHICPQGAMRVQVISRRWTIRGRMTTLVGLVVAMLFLAGIAAAKGVGHWQSVLTAGDFRRLLPQIQSLKHY